MVFLLLHTSDDLVQILARLLERVLDIALSAVRQLPVPTPICRSILDIAALDLTDQKAKLRPENQEVSLTLAQCHVARSIVSVGAQPRIAVKDTDLVWQLID